MQFFGDLVSNELWRLHDSGQTRNPNLSHATPHHAQSLNQSTISRRTFSRVKNPPEHLPQRRARCPTSDRNLGALNFECPPFTFSLHDTKTQTVHCSHHEAVTIECSWRKWSWGHQYTAQQYARYFPHNVSTLATPLTLNNCHNLSLLVT